MTGIYMRVKRANRWGPVEIEDLNQRERAEWLETLSRAELENLIGHLLDWIKEHVKESPTP